MIEVVSITKANVVAAIDYYNINNIDTKNYIGFSSNGASNVCGKCNSILSRLKKKMKIECLLYVLATV